MDQLGRTLNASVVYGDLVADHAYLPAELRAAVHAGTTMKFQRVVTNGYPELLVGMPVLTVDARLRRVPSGLEVYNRYSLLDQERQIDAFALDDWRTAGSACRSRCSPPGSWRARCCGRCAGCATRPRRLASDDLSVRLPARGSDELAELARTCNETAASVEASVGELRRTEADARRFVARLPRAADAAGRRR